MTETMKFKSLKYKNMANHIRGGYTHQTPSYNLFNSSFNLDQFLENEKLHNAKEPWCKLNKTTKITKFQEFVDNYATEHHLSEEESDRLLVFLKECIDQKKLVKVKEVVYDRDTGRIREIPSLVYLAAEKRFFLNRTTEKRVATLKCLASKQQKTESVCGGDLTVRNTTARNTKLHAVLEIMEPVACNLAESCVEDLSATMTGRGDDGDKEAALDGNDDEDGRDEDGPDEDELEIVLDDADTGEF